MGLHIYYPRLRQYAIDHEYSLAQLVNASADQIRTALGLELDLTVTDETLLAAKNYLVHKYTVVQYQKRLDDFKTQFLTNIRNLFPEVEIEVTIDREVPVINVYPLGAPSKLELL